MIMTLERLTLDQLEDIKEDIRARFGVSAWVEFPGFVALYADEYVIIFDGTGLNADVMSDDGDFIRSFDIPSRHPLEPDVWDLDHVAWVLVYEYGRIVNNLVEGE